MHDTWDKQQLEDMKKRMDKAKEVISLPLGEKLEVVNNYLEANGSNIRVTDYQIGNHRGKHAMLDNLYMSICKPHKISVF